jgi:hypothetical protein
MQKNKNKIKIKSTILKTILYFPSQNFKKSTFLKIIEFQVNSPKLLISIMEKSNFKEVG